MAGNEIHTVFYYLSKATIAIPIAVIIIALVLKLSSFNDKSKNKQVLTTKSLISITPKSIKNNQKTVSSQAKIDLKGPWVCDIELDSASASAFIKDKNIYVSYKEKNKTTYFLVKKDCLYNWEKNKFSGKKSCGISAYLDLFDRFSKSAFLNINMFMNFLPESDIKKIIASNEGKLKVENICKKEKIEKQVFELPKNILFKKVKMLGN